MKVLEIKEFDFDSLKGQLKDACKVDNGGEELYMKDIRTLSVQKKQELGINRINLSSVDYPYQYWNRNLSIRDDKQNNRIARYKIIACSKGVENHRTASRKDILLSFDESNKFYIYIWSREIINLKGNGKFKLIRLYIEFDEDEGFSEKELSTSILDAVINNFPVGKYTVQGTEFTLVGRIVDDLICFRANKVFKNLILSTKTEKKKQ